MAKDKEYSTNDEVQRSKEFQGKIDLKEKVIDFLKETLISVTDIVFNKAGYKKNEKEAGEYGDGTKFGAGTVSNQYIVKIAGKTSSILTKKIIMDGKSIFSDLEIVFKDNVIDLTYKATEQGFFRGVDSKGKTYATNEKFSVDTSNMDSFKKEVKDKLQSFAEKELGYITSTKLGVADKSEKSTSSIVDENLKKISTIVDNTNKMKKITIKELFEMDMDSDINSDKIKSLNTMDLDNTTPPMKNAGDKQLFFDDDQVDESNHKVFNSQQEIISYLEECGFKMIRVEDGIVHMASFGDNSAPGLQLDAIVTPDGKINGDNPNVFFDNVETNEVTPSLRMAAPGFSINENEDEEQIDEITTSGPTISGSAGGFKDGAPSGAGGYNTPNAWKKTSYAKGQQKRPKITKEYKAIPQNDESSKENKSSNKEVSTKTQASSKGQEDKLAQVNSKGKDTKLEQPSNKNSAAMEPKSEKNFNPKNGNVNWTNTNQTKAPKSSNDDFWTEVDLNPGSGYVPKGMEQNTIAGMHDASKSDISKRGYSEGEEKNKKVLKENVEPKANPMSHANQSLNKRKFFSLEDNKTQGINKRYLVTEKSSTEYERERWNRLVSFKSKETIKEAEEMNNFFETLHENEDVTAGLNLRKSLNENLLSTQKEEIVKPVKKFQGETVDVENPNSKFGITYKFLKEEFLNESKRYILDYNSMNYVMNPNFK